MEKCGNDMPSSPRCLFSRRDPAGSQSPGNFREDDHVQNHWMPKRMPDRMAERMSDRMPECMPERMPEYLCMPVLPDDMSETMSELCVRIDAK